MDERETRQVAKELLGTNESLEHYVERKEIEVDPDQLRDGLKWCGFERCCICGYWCYSEDLNVDGECEPCERATEEQEGGDY